MAGMDAARRSNLRILGAADDGRIVHVFFVRDRSRMRELVGRRTNGIAFVRDRTVVLVAGPEGRATFEHELFHVQSISRWGRSAPYLTEGAAVYAAGRWRGEPLRAACARIVASRRFVGLTSMARAFRSTDERVAYPMAGCFVHFVIERYGRDGLVALWRTPRRPRRALGASWRELDASFTKWLGRGAAGDAASGDDAERASATFVPGRGRRA